MAHTPAALISCLLVAGCGGGGGTPDAGPPDAPPPIDAFEAVDAGPDAIVIDGPTPPQGALCTDPIPLGPGDDTSGDSTDMATVGTGLCSIGSNGGKDAKYLVDLGETPVDLVVNVAVDEEADPPYDVVLYARAVCNDGNTQLACADAGWSERMDVLAASGMIYLFVDGTAQHGGATVGAYDLSTSLRTVVGESQACDPAGVASRCVTGFRCSASVCQPDSAAAHCDEATILDVSGGGATVTRTTFAYQANHYDGSCAADVDADMPEDIFEVTVGAGADLVASTDNSTTDFDTYVYMRSAGPNACDGAEVGCDDDVDAPGQNLTSTLSLTNLAAGTYFIFVDGSSRTPGTGTYRLDVNVTP
jgi:hypothetical protein